MKDETTPFRTFQHQAEIVITKSEGGIDEAQVTVDGVNHPCWGFDIETPTFDVPDAIGMMRSVPAPMYPTLTVKAHEHDPGRRFPETNIITTVVRQQVWYLALCTDCWPLLAQPFRDEAQRDEWAEAHASATGHNVESTTEAE